MGRALDVVGANRRRRHPTHENENRIIRARALVCMHLDSRCTPLTAAATAATVATLCRPSRARAECYRRLSSPLPRQIDDFSIFASMASALVAAAVAVATTRQKWCHATGDFFASSGSARRQLLSPLLVGGRAQLRCRWRRRRWRRRWRWRQQRRRRWRR